MPFAGAFKKLAEYMLGPQQTQGYVVRLGYSWLFGPGSRRPLWSRYYAEQMLLDNQVWFGFNIANGPLLTAKVEVKSPSAEVRQFAQQQFDQLWSQEAPKLLMVRGFGYAGFEVCYKQTDSGRIEFDRLKDFHADDAWPLTIDGRLAGISVAGIKRDDTSVLNQGKVIVRSPKSLWLTNNAQYGQWFGEADTRRAFPPWWDKASENGALDLRRLRNIKDSWVGDVVRYPLTRSFVDEQGRPLSGRDLAREIADNRLSGGAVALPSDTDDKGKELFGYQAPQGISGTRDSQEWIQDLDWDIFDGLLLPREVVEAATTGSGFSGRSFPFLVFLGVGDMRFAQYAAQIKQQFLAPLVAVNFGHSAAKELEVHPIPLVETVGEQMGKMGQPNTSTAKPGPDGQPPQQQPQSLKRPPERIAARSQQFSVYDESKHPRGQPDNAGQFASAPGGSSGDAGVTGGDSKPDGKAAWKQFLANAKLRAKEFDKLLPETDVPDLIARLSSDDFDVVDELKDAGNYLVEIGEMTPEAAESLKSLIAEVEGGLLSESEADEADEIAQEHGGDDRDTAIALSQRFTDETKYRHAVVRILGQYKPRPASPGDEHSRYLRKNKDQVKDLADEILSSIANVVPESMPGRRKALLKAAMERIATELGDVDESSQFSADPEFESKHPRGQPDNAGKFSAKPVKSRKKTDPAVAKSTTQESSKPGPEQRPADAPAAKPKRAAPGSQLTEQSRNRLRELGMTGTFPPADVPMDSIKIADLTADAEALKFQPLMSWSQKTKSGRISRQYRYTEAFHQRNAEAKFDRIKSVEPHLPKIKKTLAQWMTGDRPQRDKEAAAIASIIAETGLRPTDGDESVKHGHYGIGSLLVGHVQDDGDSIALDFIGKEGVRNQTTISDPANVAFMRAAIKGKSAGDSVFGQATSDHAGAALKAASEQAGGPGDVKLKDLRTIRATQKAREVVLSYDGPPPPLSGNKAKDAKAVAKAILSMSEHVSKILNNTPTMARDNYIHPEVWRQWQSKLSAAS